MKKALHNFDYKGIHIVAGQEIAEKTLPSSVVEEFERDGLIVDVVETKVSTKKRSKTEGESK